MKLIKRDELAAGVTARWYETYYDKRLSAWRYDDGKRKTYEALLALGPTPSAHDVDRVIGNSSWTGCRCHECGREYDSVVEVGQEPDYDSSTATLCVDCIQYALSHFNVK